jgi:hypothetical protein
LWRGELTQGGWQGKPMNVADRFIVGLVELGEQHKCTEQSTTNQKHKSKPARRLNYHEHDSTMQLKNKNCRSKCIVFLAFSMELGIKTKTN